MHIGFLTSEYPPLPTGGIGTSIRNVGRALVAQGHRVTVVGWGVDAEFEDRGVHVRFCDVPAPPKTDWFVARRAMQRLLAGLARGTGLDVVEAQDWCGLSAGMRLPVPLLVRCNGAATYFGRLLGERVRPSVRWAEWLALRQADGVAAVSQYTADVTSDLFGLRDPVHVFPNSIDVTQFSPATADDVEPDLVLYLGTIIRKKGVLDLCRIFSRLVERRPQARLRLVGRDCRDTRTGADSTWALCQALLSPAAAARVEYLGAQPYDVVQAHVRRASVCVFPSYAEALPLSWLEAMCCAKPVVAYDIGWAREIVDHGVTGVLVPPGAVDVAADALDAVLADPGAAHSMGAAARRRAEERFAAPVVARQAVAWYERAVRGSR